MPDYLDPEIWIGLITLTAVLYLIKFLQSRCKRTVYRISPESLERSKQVMLRVLPLVEDGTEHPINDEKLPYPKDNVKSAAKILAYYYWKRNRQEELTRVKNCFIALSRFQDGDLEHDLRDKRLKREKEKLTSEFECYITNSPFKNRRAA